MTVSYLGFGGIAIMDQTEDDSIRVVRQAIDAGINYFDTARCYKDSEQKIGKAIQARRDQVIIATKTHLRTFSEAVDSIDESLKMLGIEVIDVLQLHGVDNPEILEEVLGENGAFRAARQAQKQGKARFIGITSHKPSMLVQAIQQADFDTVLAQFSLTNRTAEEQLFPLARRKDIGIIIMKVLDGGLLAIPKEAAQLDINGQSLGVAQGAIKFALSRNVADNVLVGLGTQKELTELMSLADAEHSFDAEHEEKVKELAEKLGKGFCLQCGYCKPHCPEEIDIPLVFKSQIYREKFGMKRCTMWTPESIAEIAAKCTACGQCLPHCPNKLDIPAHLRSNL